MVENRLQNYDFDTTNDRDESKDLLAETVVPQFRSATKTVSQLIKDHPLASIAVGVAAGVALGCLIKRR